MPKRRSASEALLGRGPPGGESRQRRGSADEGRTWRGRGGSAQSCLDWVSVAPRAGCDESVHALLALAACDAAEKEGGDVARPPTAEGRRPSGLGRSLSRSRFKAAKKAKTRQLSFNSR